MVKSNIYILYCYFLVVTILYSIIYIIVYIYNNIYSIIYIIIHIYNNIYTRVHTNFSLRHYIKGGFFKHI